MKITLDTNCIIDLERGTSDATHLAILITSAEKERLQLRVAAICASERRQEGNYLEDFSEFETLLKRVGLSCAKILLPVGYWGITYWNHFLWGGGQLSDLEKSIHEALFPQVEFYYEKYRQRKQLMENPIDRRWLNMKCDVLAMWCHIYYEGDIFVTRDRNFHKKTKKARLIELGAKEILTPGKAAERVM